MFRSNSSCWLLIAIVACCWLLTALPAAAATPDAAECTISSTHAPTCFAWSIDWRSMLGGRRRIVQLTVIALVVGILLLIKPQNRI